MKIYKTATLNIKHMKETTSCVAFVFVLRKGINELLLLLLVNYIGSDKITHSFSMNRYQENTIVVLQLDLCVAVSQHIPSLNSLSFSVSHTQTKCLFKATLVSGP